MNPESIALFQRKLTNKDLDEMLWDWAQMVIIADDSGYPSDCSVGIGAGHGVARLTPDYFPNPKMNRLDSLVRELEEDMRAVMVGRYIHGKSMADMAKLGECHISTIYRLFSKSRQIVLDGMRKFCYKECKG